MGNWDVKLLERDFPHFAKKLWMGKAFAKLLEMLTLPSLFLFTVVRNSDHGSDEVGVRHRDSGGHGHGWVD
jgi:hypothetical protein